jgi:hypothetical protein
MGFLFLFSESKTENLCHGPVSRPNDLSRATNARAVHLEATHLVTGSEVLHLWANFHQSQQDCFPSHMGVSQANLRRLGGALTGSRQSTLRELGPHDHLVGPLGPSLSKRCTDGSCHNGAMGRHVVL